MKILKILASNSKQFRVYGMFKNWQIDDDSGGRGAGNQIQQFLRSLLLKITSSLNNFPGYGLWLKKLKNDIKVAQKPTSIKL